MKAFWYVLTVEKPFDEAQLPNVKEEICRLLDCTEISVSDGRHFNVHSRIAPEVLDESASELSRKFGARFKAGGQLK